MEEHLFIICHQANQEEPTSMHCSRSSHCKKLYDPTIDQSTCMISSVDSFFLSLQNRPYDKNPIVFHCPEMVYSIFIITMQVLQYSSNIFLDLLALTGRSRNSYMYMYMYGNKSRRSTCNKLLSSPLLRPRPMVLFSNQADVNFFPYPLPAALTCNVVVLRRQ